jgi:hypothetical protein
MLFADLPLYVGGNYRRYNYTNELVCPWSLEHWTNCPYWGNLFKISLIKNMFSWQKWHQGRLEGLCVLIRVGLRISCRLLSHSLQQNSLSTRNAMTKTRAGTPTSYGKVASPILKSVFGLEWRFLSCHPSFRMEIVGSQIPSPQVAVFLKCG